VSLSKRWRERIVVIWSNTSTPIPINAQKRVITHEGCFRPLQRE
jgi:hypothetical protein